MQPPVALDDRHPRHLADVPHRVEVPENEHRPIARAERRAQVIAAIAPRVTLNRGANRLEPPLELQAAPIHGRFVVAGRFQPRQRTNRLDHPAALAVAEAQNVIHG